MDQELLSKPPNLKTAEGSEEFVRSFLMKTAKKIIERDGHLDPAFFLLAMRSPDGESLPDPAIIHVFPQELGEGQQKDAVSTVLRDLVRQVDAIAVYSSLEAWYLEAQTPEAAKAWKGSLEHHPDRKEVVWISEEHVALPNKIRLYRAQIHRGANNEITLGEFEAYEDATAFKGRFMHLLTGKGQVN